MDFQFTTIPSDIKSELRKVVISFPFEGLSIENYLRGYIPALYDFQVYGESLEIDIIGNFGNFSTDGSRSKSGVLYSNSFSLDLNNSNSNIEEEVYRFLGRKVVLLLYTNTQRYQVGNKSQPLFLTTSDDSESISIKLKGETYFACVRHNIR
ncbi:hypothetical protein [Empedobacter brevis]|uniref:hypothetical protein n=1 Tax=Empedobacter brevis TaxID=247 RepID=UPI0028D27B17|nr:hypothetical protein [Empedobacter brevis]